MTFVSNRFPCERYHLVVRGAIAIKYASNKGKPDEWISNYPPFTQKRVFLALLITGSVSVDLKAKFMWGLWAPDESGIDENRSERSLETLQRALVYFSGTGSRRAGP